MYALSGLHLIDRFIQSDLQMRYSKSDRNKGDLTFGFGLQSVEKPSLPSLYSGLICGVFFRFLEAQPLQLQSDSLNAM